MITGKQTNPTRDLQQLFEAISECGLLSKWWIATSWKWLIFLSYLDTKVDELIKSVFLEMVGSLMLYTHRNDCWGHFYLHGLTLISAWISKHMPNKKWDEITHPFLNFDDATAEV